MLDLYLSLQKGDDIYNQSVEKMNRIIALANDVLNTLDEVTLNGKYSDAIRSEMTITSRQMVALASYTKMLLQLQGELKTKEELKEEATLMYDYMLENDELYRETWLKVNRHGVLEDSINWLNIPMGLFLQLGDSVKPKNDNLFYITPDTIDVLDEKLFSKGFLWANYGKNYPTISITNGIYSPNDIIGLIDEGSLTLLNDMLGIQGKVLAIDGDSLMENNRYQFFYSEPSPTSKMKPVLYFPCVLDGNGTYLMTAKIKFKNNSPINENVLVSTMVSDGVIHSLNGNVSFSNADENGWITVTYEFNNDEDYRYACIGINSKPEMYTDTLYVGELLLIKK